MQLRPFAPLAVIGAGLLIMTAATRPASAADAAAPTDVNVTGGGAGLVVAWTASDGSGLTDYDLVVTDRAAGKPVFERSVPADGTSARVSPADLQGATDLTVIVSAEYGSQRIASAAVRVTLPSGPAKPVTPPAVRVTGRTLKVVLPDPPDGVTGRVVRLLRDGSVWRTLSVDAGRGSLKRTVRTGFRYAAAYQDVDSTGASPFSAPSAEVAVRADAGPGAAKAITLAATDGGLLVGWSAALPQGAPIDEYRVELLKDGQRVGSAYTAGEVREVVVPGTAEDGVYTVTVTATDALGLSSASTTAVVLAR